MEDKGILLKINKREFHLNKIEAQKIDIVPQNKNINIKQDVACSILKKTREDLFIKVNTKIFVVPEALFSIEIEHEIKITLKEEISNEEIENNINEIITPLGAEVSYIIASVTKKMIGAHIVLPPIIKVDKNKISWVEQ